MAMDVKRIADPAFPVDNFLIREYGISDGKPVRREDA